MLTLIVHMVIQENLYLVLHLEEVNIKLLKLYAISGGNIARGVKQYIAK